MYAILANHDNTLTASVKQRIMQRSNLVDDLWFLVPPVYDGLDMSNATVVMKYKLPISNEFKTAILKKDEAGYKEYLKYTLPTNNRVGVELTAQPGKVELFLTFINVEMDAEGNIDQRVRHTSTATINIIPIPRWSDVIPDAALDVIDQRLIKQDAQIKALNDLGDTLVNSAVNNLVYDDEEETLYLAANGVVVGDKVCVRDMLDDGIPVIEMGKVPGNKPGKPGDGCCCCCGDDCECTDNVVEFGYDNIAIKPNCDCTDNIVTF